MGDEFIETFDPEIVIDYYGGDKFTVRTQGYNWNVKTIMNSLLHATFSKKKGAWILPYMDLLQLRDKLDITGMTDRGITDVALEKIGEFEQKYAEIDSLKRGKFNDEINDLFTNIKNKPYPDQVTGIRFLMSQERSGLFDEMGVGKTYEMLATVVFWKLLGQIESVLVITKNKEVKREWEKQIKKHTYLSCYRLGNEKQLCLSGLQEYEKDRKTILITDYDNVKIDEIREGIMTLRFDVILLDEFHMIKNDESQRSKAVNELIEKIRPTKRKLKELTIELEGGRIVKRVVNFDCKQFEQGKMVNLNNIMVIEDEKSV